MIRLEAISWSTAIVLSLFVHSIIFIRSGAQMGVENAPVLQTPLITRLSFNRPADRPVKKVEPRPVRAKPIKKKQSIQRPELPEQTEPVRLAASLPQVQGQQVSHSSTGLLQAERQQYLYKLLSHIESFKFYPRAARRRSIEGDVRISFMLRENGYYGQLKLDGRRMVLVQATRQALESAKPLPAPPEGFDLSRQIEFTMEYSLIN